MYKSPIEVFTSQVDDAIKQMREQQEEHIFQAIINVGVNIDKDELVRALQYDRGQYTKGYADGVKDLKDRLIKICNEYNFVDRMDIYRAIREMGVD